MKQILTPVIHEDEHVVARGRWRDGAFHIAVNPKVDGVGARPMGTRPESMRWTASRPQ